MPARRISLISAMSAPCSRAGYEATGRPPPALPAEGVLEMVYGFQATPWLLIHPNVQYVMDPGTFAYKHTPNAWAFGLQIKAAL